MKSYLYKLGCISVAALASGCASMPETSIDYYLPKTSASTTVYKTVSCSDLTNPVVTTNVEVKPIYSANLKEGKRTIYLHKLDTFYSSGDAEIALTEDGRIEAFNSSSTGSGSEVLSTFVALMGASEKAVEPEGSVEDACKLINEIAGEKDGKPLPLSLTFKSSVSFQADETPKTTDFKITNYPQPFYDEIAPAIGTLHYEFGKVEKIKSPVTSNEKGASIALVEPAIVTVKVVNTSPASRERTDFISYVPVPQWGNEYSVPIPTPPFFGSNTLSLTLHGSGKIKTIKYGKTNGVNDLGSAISSLSSEFKETDSSIASELKAEADVIAQQQRLLKCQTTPESCE